MKFQYIPGNETLKADLRAMADSEQIPHALLISGSPGIGKMMIARAYMAYVHCKHPVDGEPCGVCENCRLHADLNHPDVHFSYPIVKSEKLKRRVSSDLRQQWLQMLKEAPSMPVEKWLDILDAGNSQPAIHVDEAIEILRAAAYPPYSAKIKFFVIWLPERMRLEASNKLLKEIEEPAPGTCFILISNNEMDVLPTIFSRTRRLHAKPLSLREMQDYLIRRWNIDSQTAWRLAPLTSGSITKADELGSNTGEAEELRGVFQSLMRNAYSRKVGALKRLSEQVAGFGREKIIRFLLYFSGQIRENFIYNFRMPALSALSPEDEAFSHNFSPFVNASNVEDIIAETDRARLEIERNCSPKLVLFDFFLLLIPLIRRKLQ